MGPSLYLSLLYPAPFLPVTRSLVCIVAWVFSFLFSFWSVSEKLHYLSPLLGFFRLPLFLPPPYPVTSLRLLYLKTAAGVSSVTARMFFPRVPPALSILRPFGLHEFLSDLSGRLPRPTSCFFSPLPLSPPGLH